MKVLVTGSAGFLGRTLVPMLRANGIDVVGIDLLKDTLSNESYQLDLREEINIKPINFDVCIHLASAVGGFLFNANNNFLEENELQIIDRVAKFCSRSKCDQILFTSSTNIFESQPIYPNGPMLHLNQRTPYAKAKVAVEHAIPKLFNKFTIIRPTNLFGRDQKRTHQAVGQSHVIPDLLHKIESSSNGFLEVLGDGSQLRNFLHVNDAADCIFKVLANNHLGWLNVRSDIHITIAELAQILIKLSNKSLQLIFNPDYLNYEPSPLQLFDVAPLSLIGWNARIKCIESGLNEKVSTPNCFIFPSYV